MPPRQPIVLDCNCWLDLLVFRDPCVEALRNLLERGEVIAAICSGMRQELIQVLSRPCIHNRCNPDAIIQDYDRLSSMQTTPHSKASSLVCSDPDDQVFLDLALQARASHLISKDRQLLRLAKKSLALCQLEILSQASPRFQHLCAAWQASSSEKAP
ncbi:MAG: putative toxin-antitoxin system toxin component, PIN family [Betaproteobacteria bacterium]|nr:putative toxin-antitoxin system toxin component, PIN family [Betaproteobacteria bacterium]